MGQNFTCREFKLARIPRPRPCWNRANPHGRRDLSLPQALPPAPYEPGGWSDEHHTAELPSALFITVEKEDVKILCEVTFEKKDHDHEVEAITEGKSVSKK
ncbi:MAG: hypothetical protein ACJAVK_000619 [Akkermansiaceae bacterium]